MGEFKGTKGKWEVSFMGNVIDEYGREIVNPENSRMREFESAANAKLIACAPEMLECIEDLLKELSFHGFNNSTAIYKSSEILKKATE